MRKNVLMMVAFICATCMMVSCKKDCQKLSTEFIRNLPDSCELLIQVDDKTDHVVYYKGENTDLFFCWNVETEKSEPIYIPIDNETNPEDIGAGEENIIIGRKGHEKEYLQLYSLKEQRFKTLADCGWYEFDWAKKQVSCITENVDLNGDGTRVTDIYDFDGKLLSRKESEVSNYYEVPKGTLTAIEGDDGFGLDAELDNYDDKNPLGFIDYSYIFLNGNIEYITIRTSNGVYLYNEEDAEQYYDYYVSHFFWANMIVRRVWYSDASEDTRKYVRDNLYRIVSNLPLDISYPRDVMERVNEVYYKPVG